MTTVIRIATATPALWYGLVILVLLVSAYVETRRSGRAAERRACPHTSRCENAEHVQQQLLLAYAQLETTCCIEAWVTHSARHEPVCQEARR